MAILSRLCRHEIKYMKTIAMIFIIFGSQRHLKSGLSGSFMVVGRLLLDSKVGWIGDTVLHQCGRICLQMMWNHDKNYLKSIEF